MPIRVWEKGLEGVNDAMQYMIDGKASSVATHHIGSGS